MPSKTMQDLFIHALSDVLCAVDAPPFVRAFGAIAEAWRLAQGGHDCVRHKR